MFNSPSTPPSPKLTRETATMDGPPAANTPGRIQLRRTKGWRKPEGAIVVSRPTKWGNPFTVTWCVRVDCGGVKHWHVLDNRDYYPADWALSTVTIVATKEAAVRQAVAFYRADLAAAPIPAEVLAELAGHDLACWCPLVSRGAYVPCHADVLLSLANDIPMDEVIRENTRRAAGEALR